MFHISTVEDSKQPFLSFCKVEIDKVVSNFFFCFKYNIRIVLEMTGIPLRLPNNASCTTD